MGAVTGGYTCRRSRHWASGGQWLGVGSAAWGRGGLPPPPIQCISGGTAMGDGRRGAGAGVWPGLAFVTAQLRIPPSGGGGGHKARVSVCLPLAAPGCAGGGGGVAVVGHPINSQKVVDDCGKIPEIRGGGGGWPELCAGDFFAGENIGGGGFAPPNPCDPQSSHRRTLTRRVRTAPIITLFIPGTPLQTTPLQKRARSIQNSVGGAEFRTLGPVATGGGRQPTCRTARSAPPLTLQGPGLQRKNARTKSSAVTVPCAVTQEAPRGTVRAPPRPPRVTFRRVVVSLRGPGQSPVLPFACCVGPLRSVGRCGRCSRWCRFRVRGAQ